MTEIILKRIGLWLVILFFADCAVTGVVLEEVHRGAISGKGHIVTFMLLGLLVAMGLATVGIYLRTVSVRKRAKTDE